MQPGARDGPAFRYCEASTAESSVEGTGSPGGKLRIRRRICLQESVLPFSWETTGPLVRDVKSYHSVGSCRFFRIYHAAKNPDSRIITNRWKVLCCALYPGIHIALQSCVRWEKVVESGKGRQ